MIGRRELTVAGLRAGFGAGLGAGLAAGLLPMVGRAFAQGSSTVVTNAFALSDTRMIFSAKIGESGPYQFALDTGGQFSVIDDELAHKLKLKASRVRTGRSVGGAHDGNGYLIEDFRLAAGRLPPMPFIGMARGLNRGRGLSGSIGVGLFTSSDTDIDFAKKELRIYPGGRPGRDGWTKLKSRFILGGNFPALAAVEARIDGYVTELVADTGAPRNIILDAPASKASGLWDDAKPYAPTSARGIGPGLARQRIVRAKKVTIGPFAFDDTLVTLSPPGTGEDYGFTGMVGLGLLRQMNLSSDVSAKALWAQPSGVSGAVRIDYSVSGLWLTEQGGRVVIDDVGTGSPAANAGVARGDIVVGRTLPAAIAAITGSQGQEITLKLERGGAVRDVRFTLAEYL